MKMNNLTTIRGYYGSSHIPCTIYTIDGWYVIDGSVNVNRVDPDLLIDGVDVEGLPDYDTFTAGKPIESEEELDAAVNDVDDVDDEGISGLESLVNNVVNGNLQTALRQADDFNVYQMREAFEKYAGYSFKKASLTAEWLESGQNYQMACDAE